MTFQNKDELKKILIVIFVLSILLIGVAFIRWQKRVQLKQVVENQKKISQMNISTGQLGQPVKKTLPGKYYLSLDNSTVEKGDIIQLKVIFEADNKMISGSDIYLRFDPQFLQADYDLSLGSFFLNYPRSQVNNSTGLIKVTGFRAAQQGRLTTPVTVMTVSFLAQKKGRTKIDFDFIKGKTNKTTIVEKGSGKNILGKAEPMILTIL